MKDLPSLDRVRMRAVEADPNGAIGSETYFDFTQKGELVTAHYSGGSIRAGYLVGVLGYEGLDFRYAQLDESGQLDGGHSNCEVQVLPDGRLRIIEHFQWESRQQSGKNVLEEVDMR